MPPSTIPPAPPLPPQKAPPSTARSAFARFVTQPFSAYGSRPASAQANRTDVGRAAAVVPRISGITSLASQDTGLQLGTGAEITALDVNYARTHAVVAGRDILQTIRVNGTTCFEETNLRAPVHERDRQKPTRQRDALDIHAVKWSHGQFGTYIAAAATNGKVVIYDLNRPGVEVARLHEHHRQVHCLSINPFQGHMLLSGSQDATVRLWDLRDTRSEAMMCHSRVRYMGQSDGIRDVRWSPKDAVEFAFGTDGGVVQGWDYRHPKSAKLRINAHDKACTAIDWHPDGTHLLSASQDRTVQVWDFSTDSRRPKPQWTLKTPYPVFNARWRPPYWTSDSRGQGAWKCTQIATSYERVYSTVHVWDFRRLYMPFREIQTLDVAPSDMLWHSQDFLWSVNRDGRFQQTDIHYAPKVIDRRPLQALALSPLGELCVFTQKRGRRRGSELEYAEETEEPSGEKGNRAASEKTQLSRSSFDDSVDENFLSSSYKRHHERRPSNRTTKSLSSTPPSINESGVVKLDETLREGKGTSLLHQVTYRVTLDGTLDSLAFSYLAQKYKFANVSYPIDPAGIETLVALFEQNALYAQRTGLYRLTQSWRLFGAAAQVEMLRSERERDEVRKTLQRRTLVALKSLREQDVKRGAGYSGGPAVSSLPEGKGQTKPGEPRLVESNSNVPTPLARPRHPSPSSGAVESGVLPDPDDEAQLFLPASVSPHQPQPQTSFPQSYTDTHDRTSSQTAPNITQSQPINIPVPLERHLSGGSFAFAMSASDEVQLDTSGQNGSESAGNLHGSRASSNTFTTQTPPSVPGGSGLESDLGVSTDSTGNLEELEAVLVGIDHEDQEPIWRFPAIDGRRDFGEQEDDLPVELEYQLKTVLALIEAEMECGERSVGATASTTIEAPKATSIARIRKTIPPIMSVIEAETKARREMDLAFDVKKLLEECYHYYSDKQVDPQFLTHLTLLLQPSIAPGHDTLHDLKDPSMVPLVRILTENSDDREATTQCLTSTLCHTNWAGVELLHLESIITTYHSLLERHQAYNTAASIRKSAAFLPSIAEENELLYNRSKIGLLCSQCDKPINNPDHPLRCDKCGNIAQPCPICWQANPPEPLPGKRSKKLDAPTSGSLLETCMVCGHYAHPGCWDMVGRDPVYGGHCVIPQCDCLCRPGPWRNRMIKEEEERNVKGVIRGEERKVGESKAVEGARKLLEPSGSKKVAFLDGTIEE